MIDSFRMFAWVFCLAAFSFTAGVGFAIDSISLPIGLIGIVWSTYSLWQIQKVTYKV